MSSRITLSSISFLVAGALLGSSLFAQSGRKARAAATFKLTSITVTGTHRYAQADVVASTGLQAGQQAGDDDFQLAVKRLGETGAFSSVQYGFRYSPEGAKLEFQVIDADRVALARFENFVWFPEAELRSKVHERVPLFNGDLPLNGDLPDLVSDALQTMLIERNIPGRVDYLRQSNGEGPTEAFIYSVTAHRVVVHDVVFNGSGADETPQLQAAAHRLQGQDFVLSALRAQAEKAVLPAYFSRGYLKAAIGELGAKVVQQTQDETEADLLVTVDAGRQYTVSEIRLAGVKAFPPDQLRSLMQQQLGKPSNSVQVSKDLEKIKKLYETRGYMAAEVTAKPELDEAKSLVTYRIQVTEGDVYHMGELEIQLPDSHVKSLVQAKWTLHEGDVFDASYPSRFLDQAFKDIDLLREWDATVHATPEPTDKTVDVTLRFDFKSNR